ncbi:Initiation-specific alpha-1,6-mannosyltransferase [Nakaseomyces bracarensis]|uniref:Initiation-specific alpha-1,6-mannosyltransferase n=1 Tax=Nakaseomyces bracarensis TaxID=273131 RepID=A0ABR4NQA4_9SACH
MAKKRVIFKSTRSILYLLAGIVGLALLLKFSFNSRATDIQNILQNLPKEITQSINIANSNQKVDSDIMAKFAKLAEDIKMKQEEQSKQFERERKVLERKLRNLKQLSPDASLRERLAFNFEYDGKIKFPAFLWQTFSGSLNTQDIAHVKAVWQEKNPGFVHEVFDENMMRAVVHHYYSGIPEILETYDNLPHRILQVDFFKYLILLAKGGTYVDIDTTPLQPIPNWIPETVSPSDIGLIIGIEHDGKEKDWRSHYVRRLQFGTWVIQTKPGHPVIREVVAKIVETNMKDLENASTGSFNVRNDLNIMSYTGSGIFTDAVFEYLNDYIKSGVDRKVTWKDFTGLSKARILSDLLVFPSFSFNVPETYDKEDPLRPLFFVTHMAGKFWKEAPKVAQ